MECTCHWLDHYVWIHSRRRLHLASWHIAAHRPPLHRFSSDVTPCVAHKELLMCACRWSVGLTLIECALGRYPYPPPGGCCTRTQHIWPTHLRTLAPVSSRNGNAIASPLLAASPRSHAGMNRHHHIAHHALCIPATSSTRPTRPAAAACALALSPFWCACTRPCMAATPSSHLQQAAPNSPQPLIPSTPCPHTTHQPS